MDFWKELQDWYTKKGISTEQFFGGNSTEIGRDEMLIDFATRMLKQEKKSKDGLSELAVKVQSGEVKCDSCSEPCNTPWCCMKDE